MFYFKSILLLATLLFSQLLWAAGLLTPVHHNESLKIMEHKANVTVDHSFAVIEVEQVFRNPTQVPLEAIYSFPIPDNASVGQFTYWINDVAIHAEVLEKKQAKQIYEHQKKQGRNTALVEKNGFVDFKINISNVPPLQDVKLKLVYIQPIFIDHGVARFIYPLESGGTDEVQKAFWTTNDVVEQDFRFKLTLNSGYPVEEFRLPAHPQAQISNLHSQQWDVSLTNQRIPNNQSVANEEISTIQTEAQTHYQPFRLDKDIVVYWRLSSDLPGSIDMMTYRAEGNDKGTFLLTLTPGNDLEPLTQGRDWIIVLDHSGSMSGKYQTLLEGVRSGLRKLSPNDRVKVILFSDNAKLIQNTFTPAIPSEVDALIESLDNFTPSGGTNLYAGIKKAINELDNDRTSAIWLVTDGVANIGETKQKKFLSLLKQKDVRLFTFIMGNNANKPLLNGLAKASNGFAINVSNSDDMTGLLLNAASKVNHQALRDIKLSFSGVKVRDIQPESISSLYRGQQLVLTGHYWGDGELNVELKAKRGSNQVSYSSSFDMPTHGEQFPELERLWAFNQINSLMEQQQDFGEDADRKEAIVDLAVEYGLVTDYTSMLVVEEDVFSALGINRINKTRIMTEQQARDARKTTPIASTKVNETKPMFDQPRATYSNSKSSGGSIGLGFVLLVLTLLGYRRYSKFKIKIQQLS